MKKNFMKMIKNQKGQGATEYILLLIVVVALVMVFKDKIKDTVQGKVEELSGQIEGFQGE